MKIFCLVFLALSISYTVGFVPQHTKSISKTLGCRRHLGARGSISGGEFDSPNGSLFATSSSGFPSLGDGFPSIGTPASSSNPSSEGFPSLGEISSYSSPRRGVMIQNMAADSDFKIRILDREHKLGITGVIETIAIIKDARFALCRTKDRAAAILDEFVFPVDVDSQQMPPLIKRANSLLKKRGIELLWTAHTLTVKGLDRPTTEYLSWKKPYAVQKAVEAKLKERMALAGDAAEGSEASGVSGAEGGVGEDGNVDQKSLDIEELVNLDRMDAAFFADVNDEDYAADDAEGLDKRSPLLETEMLCGFEYLGSKFRVVVYEEPVSVLAQYMEDGSWRLLKSMEAELVEDAIAYKGLQNVDVEMVDA